MTTLAIDAMPLVFRRAGIGRFTYELLLSFAASPHVPTVYLANLGVSLSRGKLPRPLTPARIDRLIRISRYTFLPLFTVLSPIRKRLVADQARRIGAEVYFAPNYLGIYGKSFKTVITVHDMAFHIFPEFAQPNMRVALEARLGEQVDQAHGIVADSESTRQDMIRILGVAPERVRVVPLARSEAFRPICDQALLESVRRKYGLPERYLLFVGTLEPRKNLSRLFAAVESLAAEPGFQHKLVLVGARGWRSEQILEELKRLEGKGLAIHLGYLPDEDLAAIYNLADLFVFPSLYEGFGIPPLEAMSCGVPVVCTRVSSLPEVCGEAAAYVSPDSTEELRETIRDLLKNRTKLEELRQRGFIQAARFSWEKTAASLLEFFAELTGR
jgi:glycosyltransferase involved in cell wall biosynthesis